MKLAVWGFGAFLLTVAPAGAGGRAPLYVTAVHGKVEIRELGRGSYGQQPKPGSRWRPVRRGDSLVGVLLRTSPRSWVHLEGKFRCVDANSLIRINWDSEASIEVLRGQMSAVDGRRGKRLPDVSL